MQPLSYFAVDDADGHIVRTGHQSGLDEDNFVDGRRMMLDDRVEPQTLEPFAEFVDVNFSVSAPEGHFLSSRRDALQLAAAGREMFVETVSPLPSTVAEERRDHDVRSAGGRGQHE